MSGRWEHNKTHKNFHLSCTHNYRMRWRKLSFCLQQQQDHCCQVLWWMSLFMIK